MLLVPVPLFVMALLGMPLALGVSSACIAGGLYFFFMRRLYFKCKALLDQAERGELQPKGRERRPET